MKRLTRHQLDILRELRDGDSVADLSHRIGGNPGAVGKALAALHGMGLIEGSSAPWTYRITDAGRQLLAAENERIESRPDQMEMF